MPVAIGTNLDQETFNPPHLLPHPHPRYVPCTGMQLSAGRLSLLASSNCPTAVSSLPPPASISQRWLEGRGPQPVSSGPLPGRTSGQRTAPLTRASSQALTPHSHSRLCQRCRHSSVHTHVLAPPTKTIPSLPPSTCWPIQNVLGNSALECC